MAGMRQSTDAGLSHRAFGRRAGVRHQSIGAAIRDGRLIADTAGRLDPAHPVNAAFVARHAPGTRTADDSAAQVASLVAKAALLRQRPDDQEAELIDRGRLLDASLARGPIVRTWLAGIPDRRAPGLAVTLACPVETARAALSDLLTATTDDLGDVGQDITIAILAAR
jgi:hypothetical protein